MTSHRLTVSHTGVSASAIPHLLLHSQHEQQQQPQQRSTIQVNDERSAGQRSLY